MNTMSNSGQAKEHGDKGVPAFILIEGEEEISRHAGALSYGERMKFKRIRS